jgi:hypothetical protein
MVYVSVPFLGSFKMVKYAWFEYFLLLKGKVLHVGLEYGEAAREVAKPI